MEPALYHSCRPTLGFSIPAAMHLLNTASVAPQVSAFVSLLPRVITGRVRAPSQQSFVPQVWICLWPSRFLAMCSGRSHKVRTCSCDGLGNRSWRPSEVPWHAMRNFPSIEHKVLNLTAQEIFCLDTYCFTRFRKASRSIGQDGVVHGWTHIRL